MEQTYRYYYVNRPPFFGTEPDGYTAREAWDMYPTPTRATVLGWTRPFHGWVEYPQPLPFERVWKFDLFPADNRTAAEYSAYLESGRDLEAGRELLQDYANQGLDWLRENARRDPDAELALYWLTGEGLPE